MAESIMADIEVNEGDTATIEIDVIQDNGEPMDLTGFTGVCQIRKTVQSPDILASPVVTITDVANGKLQFPRPHNLPIDGDFQNYSYFAYEVKVLDALERGTPVAKGNYIVIPGVIK
ncbi:BppU family phage baseplate upper protein [Sporomusa malonica]|uniref:BppU N-terminal domain-containing protein n=1 Tax=Sporomusa malonica TaxID=112901 RepID=A0A1W2AQV9_9FIRM|nr:BppU family phage baseplate upper protein [Sporomusa malonica]SMC63106.1 hypothetical protein SAMN04488500_10655 [Sporomusa malonica]